MKRFAIIIALLTMAAAACLAQQSGKVAAAIVDLDGRNLSQADIAVLSGRFRTEISSTNAFDVLEREKMLEILKEQGFQPGGICDDACVVKIGKLVGVRKMIAGSVSHIGAIYSINARLIDVGTGRVEQSVVSDFGGPLPDLSATHLKKIAVTLAYRHLNKPVPDSLQLRPGAKQTRPGDRAYLPYAITAGMACLSALAVMLPSYEESTTAPGTGFAFLRIPVKARPAALGEAVVAVSDDPSGLGYNPAGLSLMRVRQAAAGYLNYVSGIQAGNVCWIQPLDGISTAAAGLTYLNSGSIKETTIDDPLGESLGSFTYSSFALAASYGRCLGPQLYAGATLKGAYEKVKEYSASGVAVDLGVLYEVDLQSVGDRMLKPAAPGNYGTSLAVGASVQNAGFATKAFVSEKPRMPMLFRAGLAYRPFMNKLTIALAGIKPLDAPFAVQTGGEYWIKGIVALRLGFNGLYGSFANGSSTDDFSGLSAGLGVRYKKYRIDYAYTPYAGLGNPMRVDISAEF